MLLPNPLRRNPNHKLIITGLAGPRRCVEHGRRCRASRTTSTAAARCRPPRRDPRVPRGARPPPRPRPKRPLRNRRTRRRPRPRLHPTTGSGRGTVERVVCELCCAPAPPARHRSKRDSPATAASPTVTATASPANNPIPQSFRPTEHATMDYYPGGVVPSRRGAHRGRRERAERYLVVRRVRRSTRWSASAPRDDRESYTGYVSYPASAAERANEPAPDFTQYPTRADCRVRPDSSRSARWRGPRGRLPDQIRHRRFRCSSRPAGCRPRKRRRLAPVGST